MSHRSDRSHRSDHVRTRALAGFLASAFVAATLVILLPGCGPAPGALADPRRNRFPLEASVAVVQDGGGAVRPYVRVTAPYASLVFFREENRFHSGLEVTVVAWRDGEQVGGGVADARVDLATVEETRTKAELEVSAPLHVRGDEPVQLAVSVTVSESSRTWWRDLEYTPRSLAAMPAWIVGVDPGTSVTPDGVEMLVADVDSLHLRVTLRRRQDVADWPGEALFLVGEITAPALTEPRRRQQPLDVPIPAGVDRTVEQAWATTELPFGRCRLRTMVALDLPDEQLILPREPALELINLHLDLDDDVVWRRHLSWLSASLDEAARDSLSDLEPADRPAAWEAIWDEPGANDGRRPEDAEQRHLLRIVAADDRFGGHRRGALSDRGRTLISWGEPARVESVPDARTPGAVWEIWEYPDRGLQVLFFDAHGMGDFRRQGDEPLDS